ncbi:hypothetical protein CTAYLR_008127 [Chrysophaeum taylorii]|uniref:RGS domain-containing protein n=1 Tax=Chrysophaeum taylorii TaxID=2483200 RepID=A0AAD7UKJ3_9STRA|nr:hypothetical protein CTAYLR_008127 [Chrysophaeum taylorii]
MGLVYSCGRRVHAAEEQVETEESETSNSRALYNRLRQPTSRELRLSRDHVRRSSEDPEDCKLATLQNTLNSIMADSQELALFKAYLHSEYGISMWDLWRVVDAYEELRVKTLVECKPDKGQHDSALLASARSMYEKYLSPQADCFVDIVPSSYSQAIRDQIDKGVAPDCHALKSLLSLALCNEQLLKRFLYWLKTSQARQEELQMFATGGATDLGQPSFRGSFEDIAMQSFDSPAPSTIRRRSTVNFTAHSINNATFGAINKKNSWALGDSMLRNALREFSRRTSVSNDDRSVTSHYYAPLEPQFQLRSGYVRHAGDKYNPSVGSHNRRSSPPPPMATIVSA